MTGEWRKLYSDKLHDLYSSPDISRLKVSRWMRWEGHVAHGRGEKNTNRFLVGNPEGMRPLGRPAHRKDYNIKTDLKNRMGGEALD
jgi:hypothetical protein